MIDGELLSTMAEIFGIASLMVFIISDLFNAKPNSPLVVALSLIFLELAFIRHVLLEVTSA